jgi:hypothetical protein
MECPGQGLASVSLNTIVSWPSPSPAFHHFLDFLAASEAVGGLYSCCLQRLVGKADMVMPHTVEGDLTASLAMAEVRRPGLGIHLIAVVVGVHIVIDSPSMAARRESHLALAAMSMLSQPVS